MGYDVSDFTDFIGRENEFLTATLFAGGDTAKFARYMAGVKGKTTVPKLSGGATLQAGFCKTPSGGTKVDEVSIEVFPFTVFESFCEDDLQTKFPNMVLAPGSKNADAPAAWQETIISLKVASIMEQLELTYWQGDTTTGLYQLFDGYIKKIDAAGTAIEGNTSNATAITKANVIGLVDDVYTALPAKVKRTKEAVVSVGDDVFDLYILAQKAANQYHYSAEHDDGMYKIGGSGAMLQRVYALDGTDRIFAGKGSDFIVGNDVKDEEMIVDAWYDKTDDLVYLRTKGKAGVTLDNIEEMVEFTLTV